VLSLLALHLLPGSQNGGGSRRLQTLAQTTAFLGGIGYELKAKTHPYGPALGTLTHD